MLTGVLAARNAALGERNDVWSVNSDAEYLEEMPADDAAGAAAEPGAAPDRRVPELCPDPRGDSGVA